MKTFQYKFTVTPDLLDEMGHVNNAEYLKLYEDARWAVLDQSGMGRNAVQKFKKGPVILEINIKYRYELRPGQEIFIETASRQEGSRIFYFDQYMHDEDGKIYSKAIFKGALFDLDKRKMIEADEKWLQAFGLA